MYSVILVSMAKHVTEAFNSLDMWEKHGYSLVQVTTDVYDALKQKPDVIICPVISSFMNAEEVVKYINEHKLTTKLVMYGRKTYEYVKEALDLDAVGYISMPPENHELSHILIKLKKKLELLNVSSKSANDYFENKDDIFIYKLIYGKYKSKEEFKLLFDEFLPKISFNSSHYQLVKITIDNFDEYLLHKWNHGKELLYTAINNFLKISNDDFCVFPVNANDNVIYALAFKNIDQSVERYIENIRLNLKDILGLNADFELLESNDVIHLLEETTRNNLIEKTELSIFEHDLDDIDDNEKLAVKQAKSYINKTYEQELSLNDVSNYVGLSSAYFSRMFKQETGENFIDYLIKVRMEKAKQYLQDTQYKTFEVSKMVGYSKSKYFSKLFKNYTGYTPTEYKSKMQRKNIK